MRCCIITSSNFGMACLKSLAQDRDSLKLIIGLLPSRFDSDFANVAGMADEYQVPYIATRNLNESSLLCTLREYKLDVIYVLGWPLLLGSELLVLPRLGVVGYHPSLLPRNRGRHPLIWAIYLGLKETGSTFFSMVADADAGPIITQERIRIDDAEDATSLYEKVTKIGVNQFKEIWRNPSDAIANACEQVGESNTWRKRSRLDGLIDWRMSASDICRLFRSLVWPYPGAEFRLKKNLVPISNIRICDDKYVADNHEPGKILEGALDKALVKVGDGAVYLQTQKSIDFSQLEYLD